MNLAGPSTQRTVTRPDSAGPPMPQLRIPRIALPGIDHRGTPLAELTGPPEPGSRAADADLATTYALVSQRSRAGDAWARALDLRGVTAAWEELASHASGDAATVQALVGAALSAAGLQAGLGKRQWMRPRPFQADPSIDVVGRTPKRARDSSHPSGHAARAYAAARVIGTLDPTLRDQAWQLAREVAISRVYAGVHYASDVVAGARLGIAAAESVLDRWRDGTLEPTATDGARVATMHAS